LGVSLADMDLTDYDGVSFYIKAEPAVAGSAMAGENNETWIVGSWHVPKKLDGNKSSVLSVQAAWSAIWK